MSNPQAAVSDPYAITLRAAEFAKWSARPNPAVGALACYQTQGHVYMAAAATAPIGGVHAEPRALSSLERLLQHQRVPMPLLQQSGKRRSNGIILYVSLMPCTFTGRTAPCVDVIVKSPVSEVHVALADNDARMGAAVALLRRAGITVKANFSEPTRRALFDLNLDYYYRQRTGMPFVTLKYAMSLDGNIASHAGIAKWLSTPAARNDANIIRGRSDAVFIGARTLLLDQPRLTTRLQRSLAAEAAAVFPQLPSAAAAEPIVHYAAPESSPLKPARPFILCLRDFTAAEASRFTELLARKQDVTTAPYPFLNPARLPPPPLTAAPVFIVPEAGSAPGAARLRAALEGMRVEITTLPADALRAPAAFRDFIAALAVRYQLNSIFVEGGARTSSFFRWSGLTNRIIAYIAPQLMSDDGSSAARALPPFVPVRSYLPELAAAGRKLQAANEAFTPLVESSVTCLGRDLRVTGYHDDAATVTALWDDVKTPKLH